jgi:hypothetical protein
VAARLRPEHDPARYAAECSGKEPYTEGAAEAMLAYLIAQPRQHFCWLTTYRCSFCECWHLGNTRKKR